MSELPIEQRNALIQDWLDKKAQAVAAVEAERNARQTVSQLLFPEPKKGTQRYDLGGGYNVKLVYGTTYTLGADFKGKDRRELVAATQDKIEALGNEGALLADRLIVWKPELSATEYEKLDTDFPVQAEAKALIDHILTTKPASPQMEFEQPKKGK